MVCHLINKTFRQQSQLTQSVTEAACNNRPCMCCAIACRVKSLMICEIKGKQSADLSRYHVLNCLLFCCGCGDVFCHGATYIRKREAS